MIDLISQWFATAGFMPHGQCYLWRPALLWTIWSRRSSSSRAARSGPGSAIACS